LRQRRGKKKLLGNFESAVVFCELEKVAIAQAIRLQFVDDPDVLVVPVILHLNHRVIRLFDDQKLQWL
jgi:hypothetical protein